MLLTSADYVASAKDPLWQLLAKATTDKPPTEIVRTALDADPSAATRPFAAPAGWAATEGALVKLEPGVKGKKDLPVGELATVLSFMDFDGCTQLKRQRNG